MTLKHSRCVIAVALMATFAAPAANAQFFEPPIEDMNVNLVGLAIGAAPDYSGSNDTTGAAGPVVRYQFQNSERYFLWLGPTATLNLVNDSAWRAGPMLNYRGKRDSDVEDKIVKQMDEIDAKVEAGAFVQYRLKLSNTPMHQMTFTGDVAGSSNGTVAHLRMMYFQPLSEKLIANIGLGSTFGNDKFARTYYGVTSAHDIALFPTLAGHKYDASGGLIGVNIPFGISWMMNKQWLLSAGGRYEKLQGDAKDSPIVSERGKSDQWIAGGAISYMF